MNQFDGVLEIHFPPKSSDVHIDHVVERRGARSLFPDITRQRFARYHLSLIPHEELEELEFADGEIDRLRGSQHLARDEIHFQIADRKPRRIGYTTAANQRTNARELAPGDVPDGIELVTVDVSFISVRLLLPRLREVAPRAELLVLVKPQFEVGRGRVGKGGVVRDDALRAEAVAGVREAALGLGYAVRGEAESRLSGPKGNREVFVWLAPGAPGAGAEPAS